MMTPEKDNPRTERRPFKWWQILVIGVAAIFLFGFLQGLERTAWVQSVLEDAPGVALICLLMVAALGFYLLPTLIGKKRDISTLGPLFFINVVLGWTLIGWLACLIWAAAGATKAQDEFYRKHANS